jgi:hypothetical protein
MASRPRRPPLEMTMVPYRKAARRLRLACAAAALLTLLAAGPAVAEASFPFDRTLMMDTAPMGRVKRVPMLNVEANGNAIIKLWCKDVVARVDVSQETIHIEAAPLPESLPPYMVDGQCSPARMQADSDLLATIVQVTAWKKSGDGVVLSGPTTLRFFASSH